MTYASEVLADSPLAYWRQGDLSGTTMTDSSGNGRNGTYNGTVTLGQTGIPGGGDTAVNFLGTGYALCAAAAWQNQSAAFTVEAWIKYNTPGTWSIVDRDTTGTPRPWQFRVASGRLQFLRINNAAHSVSVITVQSSSSVDTNAWVHCVATYDGTDLRLYVNKVLEATVAMTGGIEATSVPDMIVGANTASAFQKFPGLIDEVAYYSTTLSGARITAHYDAGVAAPPVNGTGTASGESEAAAAGTVTSASPYQASVLADAPLAWYRLGEATGDDMLDSSGHGRHGALNAGGLYNRGEPSILPAEPTLLSTEFLGGYGEVAHDTWMDVSAISAEVWVDSLSADLTLRTFVQVDENASPATEQMFVLGNINGSAVFNFITTAGPQTLTGTVDLTAAGSHHVVATYDGTTARIYVDDAIDVSAVVSSPLEPGTGDLSVAGTGPPDFARQLSAVLQEVALYGTALTAARVHAHYLAGTGNVDRLGAGTGSGESDAVTGPTTRVAAGAATASGESTASAFGAQADVGTGHASGESDAHATAGAPFHGTARNRVGGRVRSGIGYATYEPPVVPVPIPFSATRGWDAAQAFAAPTISASGRPSYTPQIKTKKRQRDRILVGGVDVTYFRGVPTPFPGFSLEEPLMYGAISLAFPQIAAPYERIGHGALSWLHAGAEVLIQRVNVDTDAVEARDYRGVVVDFDVSGPTFTVTVGGEAMGRMALVNRQVPIWTSFQDIGRYAYSAFKEVNLRLAPYLGPETGIRLQRFGGQSVLDYVNELLSRAWNRAGNQWTIMPVGPGKYRMFRKDTDTIHGTVYNDDARTVANLHRAVSEEPNRIFGTGVTPAGMRVRNAVYPGLVQGPAAPYPYTNHGTTFGVGTVDADTDTGDGVTLMIQRLIITKYLDQENHPGGYTNQTAAAIRDLQEDAGATFTTGTMDFQTWKALWDLDVTGYSLRWSHIEPMAQRSRVRKWNRSGTGGVIGRNDQYDPAALVVDRNVDFGSGFTSDQMHGWARAELGPEDNWTGTITFGLGGLVVGDHTPGDPITEANVMRARDLRPGMNLRLPHFDGGITVHVASVDVPTDGPVTAAVDTRARDAMKVWEVITRNRESARNPARAHAGGHRSSTMTQDSMGIWDEVGGLLNDDIQVPANTWVVFPTVAGQEGTVRSIKVTTSPEAEFVVAVFGDTIYPARLASLVGNPLTKHGSKMFANEAVRDALDKVNLLLYVAGSWEQPCGYFPGTKVDENEEGDDYPLTGRWEDDASYSYHTGRNPVLYVAVYADRNTVIPAGRIMRQQLEAGV